MSLIYHPHQEAWLLWSVSSLVAETRSLSVAHVSLQTLSVHS